MCSDFLSSQISHWPELPSFFPSVPLSPPAPLSTLHAPPGAPPQGPSTLPRLLFSAIQCLPPFPCLLPTRVLLLWNLGRLNPLSSNGSYSSSPHPSVRDIFKAPIGCLQLQVVPNPICTGFFLYILLTASYWQIWIARITTLELWGHY